jgi:hypothetical protein
MFLVFQSTQIEGLQQSVRDLEGDRLVLSRLVGGEVSSSSERKNTMVRKSSRYSSRGGSALSAQPEL